MIDGELARMRSETGQTVVELAVTAAILGIVLSAFMGILVVVQQGVVREQTRTTTVDQARLALEALDREVRSGNVLYNPALDSPIANYGLRIATTAVDSSHLGEQWCIQYRVTSSSLKRRVWKYSASSPFYSNASTWRTVATNIVNSGATDAPFQLDTAAAAGYGGTYGSRTVNVAFLVNADPGDVASSTVRLQSAISVRRQTADGTPSYCVNIPP